ncbi:MAG: 5'-3' exonuclease H3TH domain-containing protein, partial [Microgenomates group bacterium]
AGIVHIEKAGFEADDVIGTISRISGEEGYKTYILTGDKDIVQLVDKTTFVIAPKKGISDIMLYTEESALEKFGIPPHLIPELKGLMGDPSDNYKGVTGIGPKTAATLLTQFNTVENIYEHLDEVASPKTRELLEKGKESALMSQRLATILRDLELDFSIDKCVRTPYNQSLRDFFEKLEFNTLLKRYFDSKQPAARLEKIEKIEEKEKTNQLDLF